MAPMWNYFQRYKLFHRGATFVKLETNTGRGTEPQIKRELHIVKILPILSKQLVLGHAG